MLPNSNISILQFQNIMTKDIYTSKAAFSHKTITPWPPSPGGKKLNAD